MPADAKIGGPGRARHPRAHVEGDVKPWGNFFAAPAQHHCLSVFHGGFWLRTLDGPLPEPVFYETLPSVLSWDQMGETIKMHFRGVGKDGHGDLFFSGSIFVADAVGVLVSRMGTLRKTNVTKFATCFWKACPGVPWACDTLARSVAGKILCPRGAIIECAEPPYDTLTSCAHLGGGIRMWYNPRARNSKNHLAIILSRGALGVICGRAYVEITPPL